MKEYRTKAELLEALAHPGKEDFDALAVSLLKNFEIRKQEADSAGGRDVRFRIADLEIYYYTSARQQEDPQTISRDCLEGQWFVHGYGVDLAFRTLRESDEGELTAFGGILMRGLERMEDGQFKGAVSGSQRCLFELFNATSAMPQLCEAEPLGGIRVYNTMRVESQPRPFRYFREGVDWEAGRRYIHQSVQTIDGEKIYHVWNREHSLTKDMTKNRPPALKEMLLTQSTPKAVGECRKIYPED